MQTCYGKFYDKKIMLEKLNIPPNTIIQRQKN